MPTGIYKRTKEHKRKLSEVIRGKKHPLYGKHHSKTTKEKISKANKGREFSEETKKKMSITAKKNGNGFKKGHKFSKETKKRMSKAQKGRKPTPYQLERAIKVNTGNKYALGIKRSNEFRRKVSKAMSGKKSHLWKHGKSKQWKKRYKDVEYKIWREKVFKRDDFICQKCFRKRGQYITAHHIKSWANYPKLRYKLNNGMTLCEKCHSETDNYKGRNKSKKYERSITI